MTADEAKRILMFHVNRCVSCKDAINFLVGELARKDEALREIMADDALFEANPDAFGRHAWARIRGITRFALGEQV